MAANNRIDLGLKGPVLRLTEERFSPSVHSRQEWTFNELGETVGFRQVGPGLFEYVEEFEAPPEGPRVLRNSDGSTMETQDIVKFGTYAPRGLRRLGLGFPTGGAASAETDFTTDGVAVRTVFRDAAGNGLSSVLYTRDENSRTVEARQYNGYVPQTLPDIVANSGTAMFLYLSPAGAEASRTILRYDGSGRLREVEMSSRGQFLTRVTYEYNADGDMVTTKHNDDEPVRTQYEYDAWRNWTRKIVHHGGGPDEWRRLITYYTAD
jgi:hypothetical protein